MSGLSFSHLWPLWLVLALPVVWLAALRQRTRLSQRRLILAAALRSVALALLIAALMQPALQRAIHDVSVVYALDVSRSVSPAFIQTALDWIAAANRKAKPAQMRYVVFGDRARLFASVTEAAAAAVTPEDAPWRDVAAISQAATNIEQALDVSLFGFAPNHAKRLVLLSDGNQTEGDVWRAVPRLQAQGVRVFAVPAAVAVNRDTWVAALQAPEGVRQQEPVTLKAQIFSLAASSAEVELQLAGEAAGRQAVRLVPGENQVSFEMQFKQSGANTVTVKVVAPGDQVPENDALTETIWVAAKPKLLYVEKAAGSARYLREALGAQGIDVTVSSVEAFAASRAELSEQDAVILSDVPAGKLNDAAVRRLEEFVQNGGGLIFSAGENTYGKQGFAKSRLEKLLPVKFEGERKRKDLDLVLLIDRSFSMRGKPLEFAKSAALATLDLLEEQHRLAVVAFDSRPHEVVPLLAVGNKRRAEDLISGMSASGQTNIFNALWHAYGMLQNSEAKTKHIILLSDGNTAPPGKIGEESASSVVMELVRKARGLKPPEAQSAEAAEVANAPDGFEGLAQLLAEKKITVSTVAIGEKPNLDLLSHLAKWANGKSHIASNEAEIPSLFVNEAKRLLGESIIEEPFRPIVKVPAQALSGIDFAKAPRLKGFVVARPKLFSEVLLDAKDHKPLLVQTHYGLGKTVAFLSDVKNRWAADWLNWPGFGKLWAQVVRESIRRDSAEELALRVSREGREAVVTLTALAADGRFREEIAPAVRVTDPGGNSTVAQLRQAGPGRYEVRVPLLSARAAPYRFELVETPGLTARELARTGARSLYYPYSDEYRVLPADRALLAALSEKTGGKFVPTIEEIFANRGDGGRIAKPLWQYFAAGALVLFLAELAVRRT